MKPKSPFTQPFNKLPKELPVFPLENALLPGGQLPLEISEPADLSMFFDVLKTDQLIGMIQMKEESSDLDIYSTGCAGRIRQYRERKDGKINIMLTGICRYRVLNELPRKNGYRIVNADWSDFKHDYETEEVDTRDIDLFKANLRNYFTKHNMTVDWGTLNKLPIEEVVNNLVLVMDFNVNGKQQLLESPTVKIRLELFAALLDEKPDPIWVGESESKLVN